MAIEQPKFVFPGFRFDYVEATDTVDTHMLIKACDGSVRWEITHTTTAQIFEQGAEAYMECVAKIRAHHARQNIAALPKRKTRNG